MTEPKLVQIDGSDIVIRITPEMLRHATEQGVLSTFSVQKNDFRLVEVMDMEKWRRAIFHALCREQENGDTPVHLMLDECLEWACEQGEEGVRVEGVHDD